MSILIGDITHGAMIARAANTTFDVEVDNCISRIDEAGSLRGGFILTNYNGAIVTAHMAGSLPNWCSPELLWLVFDYCFLHLRVRRVLATVGSENKRAYKQVVRAGFVHEHTIEGGTPNGDLILLSMSRETCKWLSLRPRYVRANGHGELANVVHAA